MINMCRVLFQVPASLWLCGSSKGKKHTAADVVGFRPHVIRMNLDGDMT